MTKQSLISKKDDETVNLDRVDNPQKGLLVLLQWDEGGIAHFNGLHPLNQKTFIYLKKVLVDDLCSYDQVILNQADKFKAVEQVYDLITWYSDLSGDFDNFWRAEVVEITEVGLI